MKMNKLRYISINVCCFIVALCSLSQGMEINKEEINKIDNIIKKHCQSNTNDIELTLCAEQYGNPLGIIYTKLNGKFCPVSFFSSKQWDDLKRNPEIMKYEGKGILLWSIVDIFKFRGDQLTTHEF